MAQHALGERLALTGKEGGRRIRLFFLSAGFDLTFLAILFLILSIGIVTMFSASYADAYYYRDGNSSFFILRQLIAAGIGLLAMFGLSMLDYHLYYRFWWLLYAVSVGLLVVVLFTHSESGIHRWISLPVFGQFQPSEIGKLAAIMAVASLIAANYRQMDKMKTTEPGTFYSEYYKRLVNLDCGIYTLAPGADKAECMEFMHRVSPSLTKMKNIVLGSKSGYSFAKEDYGKLKAEYLYKGFPIRSVFIGSSSGAKLLYPWRGNYSRNIDPRQRTWYRNALGKNGPVWGKPYMDIDSVSGLSIPCSIQIIDLDGNFRGVAGLDLSVNQLTNSILNKGNVGEYVIEKAVINPAGEVIFSSKSEYFNKTFDPDKYHQNAEFRTPLYPDEEIRDRILKNDKKFGIFSLNRDGKTIVCSFAYLEILNMYYLVTGDYRELLEHVRSAGQ